MLDKVIQFVDESFGKKKAHFERTVYWLKILKPDVDEPMLIAAYAHDIKRAFNPATADFFKDRDVDDSEYLEKHQKGGAEIIAKFLRENNYPLEEIERVINMISRHEVGGDEESDLLKDADSISYFEVNTPTFIEKFKVLGKDKIKSKHDFMFNRITSEEAKRIAEPMYENALRKLEKAEF